MKDHITIYPGFDKSGNAEQFDSITLYLGEIVSIVGHTGSGKTMLISDIEQLSQKDSASGRKILIDDEIPDYEDRFDPEKKEIAMITQNTKCVSDLAVDEFITIHAEARKPDNGNVVDEVISLANIFTGEYIKSDSKVTELSGGQTRALLFADAILIGASPIILVDEIENAGINKEAILKHVKDRNKLIIFATHDPGIVLQTQKRILMKNGAICEVILHDDRDDEVLQKVREADRLIKIVQENIRNGYDLKKNL